MPSLKMRIASNIAANRFAMYIIRVKILRQVKAWDSSSFLHKTDLTASNAEYVLIVERS